MATTPVSQIAESRRSVPDRVQPARRCFHSGRSYRRPAPDRPDGRRVRDEGSAAAIPELEQHKEGLMAQLLKKAGELGLLGGAIPEEYGGSGLDKVSATVLAEKLAGYASFAVSHGGHAGIGTIPIVYFGTEEQKKKYLPKIATGRIAFLLLPVGAAGGFGRAGVAHARGAFAGRQELDSERAENVDHERRIRGRVHGVRESGRREIFLLHRGARHAGIFRGRGRKKDGHPGQLDGAAIFRECAGAEGKPAARNRARAHCGVQHAECGALLARRVLPGRREEDSGSFVEICEGADGIRQNDLAISA